MPMTTQDSQDASSSGRLIVVANRLPMTARLVGGRWPAEPSSGGLVSALAPLIRARNGLWIGWAGEVSLEDPNGQARLLDSWGRRHGYVPVRLPATLSRAFYEGYANDTLWPILHGFPSRVVLDPETWQAYRDANERFARVVLARLEPDDLLWVHDYQLMLLPELVRAARPDAAIGFFLHVPFPPSEVFRMLPQREQLLRGLLGADLIAFQTHGHLQDFRRALLHLLGLESRMDQVTVGDRMVRLEALPIGIVRSEWDGLAERDASVSRRIHQLESRLPNRQLVLGVDRLDYTKGLPERLRAYRRLLRSQPERKGSVTLIQIAVPSREHVPAYRELRREVSELVGELVGEFATPEWSPIVYLNRSVPKRELAALYTAADVAWVSPLRDGMNLVAKEFVTSQGDRPGVLMISEFAGAAQEMAEAIRVNPYDEEGSAEALGRALDMPVEERRERMAALQCRLRRNDADAWCERFLETLRLAASEQAGGSGPSTRRLPVDEVVVAAAAADRRLVILDYDGTLVSIAARPSEAVPTPDLIELIGRLAARSDTTVAIVSGRRHDELERWFGGLQGIWLAAEHGALLRRPGETTWSPMHEGADTTWKERVRPMLELFAARTPGSLIEEKRYSLAWHYRQADPEFGAWLANELAHTLNALVAGTDLAVLLGARVVEVRFAWAQKGEVLNRIVGGLPLPSFTLAIGDDRTDEELFERLPPDAWTVPVQRERASTSEALATFGVC